MKFLLYFFRLNTGIIKEILGIIRKYVSKGYMIAGKNIRGILAAIYYLYSESEMLEITQEFIAKKFNTNPITLRMRKQELNQFLSTEVMNDEIDLIEMRISSIEKSLIIENLLKIFDKFKENYETEFLLRDFINRNHKLEINRRIEEIKKVYGEFNYDILNEDEILKKLSKNKRDKARFHALINEVINKHPIPDSDWYLKLFRIIIDIQDFALGGTLEDIAKTHDVLNQYILSIAKRVLSSKRNLYIRRFYRDENLEEDLISIADKVIKDKIILNDFSNLLNPQLQDLMATYQKEKRKNGGIFKSTSMNLDFDFMRWLVQLALNKLNTILKNHSTKLSKTDCLKLCSRINKNSEVLKFIAYYLINSPMSELKISEFTGKSAKFIERCGELIYRKKVHF